MRTFAPDELYELLPALYRLRDVDEGHPLQALLRVIGEQAAIVEQNLDRLWDDFFIETSQDWVIPYIGDLVANNLLRDAGTRLRVDVARTIYYRRRKGTLPMLEELARDVTGWGGRAVELFELLGWMQNLNHLRFQAGYPDLRDVDALDRIDGPFDQVSHTVDVRPPSSVEGRHNIPNIGFFLYRLSSYPRLSAVLRDAGGSEVPVRPMARPASSGSGNRFHFSPLRARGALFTRWRREGDPGGLAQEIHVPGPIRPRAFAAETGVNPEYYDPDLSLAVFVGGVEVPAAGVICKDLSTWAAPSAGSGLVAVDVTRGRLAFAEGEAPEDVTVHYHYGFSGDVGGGPYDRRRPGASAATTDFSGWGPDTVADPEGLANLFPVSAVGLPSIQAAVTAWENLVPPKPAAVIQIEDDRTYPGDLSIDMAGATRLVIQARNGRCPTVLGDVVVTGAAPDARLVLDGLHIEGQVRLDGGDLARLRLSHCTLVPGLALGEDGLPEQGGEPSILAGDSYVSLTLVLYRSTTGGLALPADMELVEAVESIIDGVDRPAISGTADPASAGPPADLRRVTALGEVRVRSLPMASEVIFTGAVQAQRTQDGCVRFSYVPPGSRTPRRYRCQPDLALGVEGLTAAEKARIRARLVPAFTSVHHGDPGYAQLSLNCPCEILTGAEDESEMGVFSFLKQPQRTANLRMRLDEYLPFGLEPALIFVT